MLLVFDVQNSKEMLVIKFCKNDIALKYGTKHLFIIQQWHTHHLKLIPSIIIETIHVEP